MRCGGLRWRRYHEERRAEKQETSGSFAPRPRRAGRFAHTQPRPSPRRPLRGRPGGSVTPVVRHLRGKAVETRATRVPPLLHSAATGPTPPLPSPSPPSHGGWTSTPCRRLRVTALAILIVSGPLTLRTWRERRGLRAWVEVARKGDGRENDTCHQRPRVCSRPPHAWPPVVPDWACGGPCSPATRTPAFSLVLLHLCLYSRWPAATGECRVKGRW